MEAFQHLHFDGLSFVVDGTSRSAHARHIYPPPDDFDQDVMQSRRLTVRLSLVRAANSTEAMD